MTLRSVKTLAAALLMLLALPAAARASDVDDCRSKTESSSEALIKACSAVIAAGQASPADMAYAYYRRSMVTSANPNMDEAQVMADVSKAIELDPKLMEAYAFRALAYNHAMQYDKAVADLTQAIALAPDRWGLYSLRAMIYAQKKDDKSALADYQSALSHDPPASSADLIRQRIGKLQQQTPQ